MYMISHLSFLRKNDHSEKYRFKYPYIINTEES